MAVQDTYCRNLMPGFGNPPDQDPPKELDWDMWLGPAPARAYNPNRGIYHFRWIWDYAGGQMTNLGQHSLDIVQWFTGVNAPKSVYSTGGRTYLKDNMETPDSQDVLIDYPGFTGICHVPRGHAGRAGLGMGGVMFYGTRGMMSVGRSGYEVFPDRKANPFNTMANILGGHPVGGPQPTPEPQDQFWTEKEKDTSGDGAKDYVHARAELPRVHSLPQAAHRRHRECARRGDDVPSGQYLPAGRAARSPGTPRRNRSSAIRRRPTCWCARIAARGTRNSAALR